VLVTFRTPAHGDLTYFGDVALTLIRLMGHSGTVPGALAAEDVPAALKSLREGVSAEQARAPQTGNGDEAGDEEPVSLGNRAQPLVELLEAAASSGDYVMWTDR
jgi:hypothetical protein